MSVFMVPEPDRRPWPTLGPQVVDWIQRNLVFGPGLLRGQRAIVDEETQALLAKCYEVYPRGTEREGQLRFDRVGWSMRKGVAKTEKGAWLCICELHPEAPVRVVGWKGKQPLGGGVADPYIPIVSYTEQQSEDLAYGTMLAILQDENCPIGGDFDLGLERIMRIGGDGKAAALATAPDARDGARTTFQLFDETHRLSSPRLRKAHQTMLANMPKRFNVWTLEITTAFAPGENSVAESTMAYAQAVADGKVKDSKLFYFHRQASDHHDITTVKGRRAAVREASGPHARWSNIDAIVAQYDDPTIDKAYWERVWTNRVVRASDQAFDVKAWKALGATGRSIPPGVLIVLGFDGARRGDGHRFGDSVALVATEVATGLQEVLGLWEDPQQEGLAWEAPAGEVEEAIALAFERFDVWRLYADPPYWESNVAAWSGTYGEERVVKRYTGGGFETKTAHAVRAFHHAILAGEVSHNGDERFVRHLGNARKKLLARKDDDGQPLWSIQKERPHSPRKIDAAVAAVLSWEARGHAIAEGAVSVNGPSVYEERGMVVL